MPKVFIVQRPRRRDIEVSGLAAFGEPVELLPDEMRRPSVFDTQAFASVVLKQLAKHRYDPEEDYFAVVGSVIGLVIGVLAASMAVDVKMRLLVYNAASNEYRAVTVDLNTLEDVWLRQEDEYGDEKVDSRST